MIRLLIFMILSFSCIAGAFEPLKNTNVALFWDYDKTINAEEIALVKQKVSSYLKTHTNVVNESDNVPEWLGEYHSQLCCNGNKEATPESFWKVTYRR